jgi:serine/threonine-protein kinase
MKRALAVLEKALGPNDTNVAVVLDNLAGLHREMGDLSTAREEYERALGIEENNRGPNHPTLAYDLMGLARIARAQGDYPTAIQRSERAVQVRETGDVPPLMLADTRFLLAELLWESESDRPRARSLAGAALSSYTEEAADGETTSEAETHASIKAWVSEHP